eukprot:scaffold8215_cov296-Pinguiococcus_pyrenoidosus.AAC.1
MDLVAGAAVSCEGAVPVVDGCCCGAHGSRGGDGDRAGALPARVQSPRGRWSLWANTAEPTFVDHRGRT